MEDQEEELPNHIEEALSKLRKDILKKKQVDVNVEIFVPSKPPKVRKQEAQITEIKVDLTSSPEDEAAENDRDEVFYQNDDDFVKNQDQELEDVTRMVEE